MATAKEDALRTVEQRLARLQKLLPLLACPVCGGALTYAEHELVCQSCSLAYQVMGGVPVLIPPELVAQGLGAQLGADENISKHPYSPASSAILEEFVNGLVLDLGAGGKHIEYGHVVQVDVFRFPMTDVVASADCLPFKANTFDALISQAVFEHLQYPDMAAEEVRRVLKLGGVAKIDTAFLQPEHAYPHHYFNATEAGLRHWFRNFDIQWSGVEPYQRPMWSLEWLLSDYLEALGDGARPTVEAFSIGQVVGTLRSVARGCASSDDLQRFDVLQNFQLPEANRRLAAGVSVRAVKHVPCDSRRESLGAEDLAAERRAQFLQGALESQAEWISAVGFAQKLATHRSRWLALQLDREWELDAHLRAEVGWRDRAISELQALQKAPPLSVLFYWWCVSTLKRVLPLRLVEQLRRWRTTGGIEVPQPNTPSAQPVDAPLAQPVEATSVQSVGRVRESVGAVGVPLIGKPCENWVHIEVTPQTVHDLLDQFFSLVHQTHTDWCLHLLVDEHQPASVKNTMRLLQTCDSRVSVVTTRATSCAASADCNKQGWSITLPPDVKLHPEALLEVANLARSDEGFSHVVGNTLHLDFGDLARPPLVCLAGKPEAGWPSTVDLRSLSAWPAFEKLGALPAAMVRSSDVARIPKVLFYRWSMPTA